MRHVAVARARRAGAADGIANNHTDNHTDKSTTDSAECAESIAATRREYLEWKISAVGRGRR